MLRRPFPAPLAGFGKTLANIGMLVIERPGYIDPVFLDVIAVVAETVDGFFGYRQAGLQQLVILVVTCGQGGIQGSADEKVDVGSDGDPFIIKAVLDAHAISQLAEAGTPDPYAGSFLLHRIHSASRHDYQRVVHRSLEDVDQRNTEVTQLHGLHQLQRGGLALVFLDTGKGRFGSRGMDNFHVQPGLFEETLFLGHIIAGKLRLGQPLRRKHQVVHLGHGGKCRPEEAEEKERFFIHAEIRFICIT